MRLLLFLLAVLPAGAAIDPTGLVLEVRQEQLQQSQLAAKTSDGRRDRSAKSVRVLDIGCRYMGTGHAEPATLRWFFIGRNASDGKFDYYSHGLHALSIPRDDVLRVRAVSEPLRRDEPEGSALLPSVHVAARAKPQGWVVWVLQGERLVKTAASEPGLLEWMKRNPPPRAKK